MTFGRRLNDTLIRWLCEPIPRMPTHAEVAQQARETGGIVFYGRPMSNCELRRYRIEGFLTSLAVCLGAPNGWQGTRIGLAVWKFRNTVRNWPVDPAPKEAR